jgi:hypothetical protein
MADYTPAIIASIVSFAVGWFSHALSSRREREARAHEAATARDNRKRAFRSFLRAWRAEIERESPSVTANKLTEKIILFEGEVAKISGDYPQLILKLGFFEEVVHNISNLTPGEIEERRGDELIGRDRLLEAIRTMEYYVVATPDPVSN